MSSRRGFLKQVTTGLMAMGLGARDLLAQLRFGHMMESPPGAETVIDGKRYLYFGGTMSKAFGSHGGIVPGPKGLVDEIWQSHVVEGATDPTTASAAASIAGMDILMKHPELRTKLLDNGRRLKEGLRRIGFPVGDAPFPVAAWKLKSAQEMDRVHQRLMDRGICIQRTHYVGAGTDGVLRAVAFSTHTTEQIDRLLAELKALV